MSMVVQHEIQDQAGRQRALDPQYSFIVQAPAGSGKTGLLTQRFLVLLATVNDPEEIVAITFTRKAASEMKHRILQALRKADEEAELPADPYQRQLRKLAKRVLAHDQARGWRLLQNPSRLRIQTIDSLCAWLVERMPVSSRQGALSSVAENADELYLEAARLTIGALEEESEWAAAIEHLISHLDNRLDRLQRLIADMLARRDLWLRHVVDAADSADMREHLELALADRVTVALGELAESSPAGCREEIIELMQFAATNLTEADQGASISGWPGKELEDRPAWVKIADFLLTQEGNWRKQVTKANGFPAPSSVRDTEMKERLTEMKQRMAELLSSLQEEEAFRQRLLSFGQLPPECYTNEEWETLQALFSLLKVAAGYLLLVFRQHGQVDFTEIAMAAVRALGEPEMPTDLVLALDYRIRHILVDEFQDTSSSQAELLQRLTAGWQAGDGRTLFLVGDPMQSIYRFRQAEVGLFLDIRDRGYFGRIQMEFLRLSVNFRSRKEIVDWVNCYFSQILPDVDDVGTGAVSYADSVAFHATSGGKAVKVYPCLQQDDQVEAEQVVAIVRQASTAQPDGKIAVLVRNRSHLANIITRFRREGLSFQAVEIEQLAQRTVIRDLMALTRALVHPADRIAWLSLLRAPFCGLSLQDLYTVANTLPEQVLIDSLHACAGTGLDVLSEEGRLRVNRVLPILERALMLCDRMSLRRSVEGTWISLGGPACVQDETDLADAEVYFQLLEDFDVAGYRPDIQELDEQLIRLFALPDVTADDSLQLMTLHKAKGLEFDTVILPGLGKSSRRDQEKLLNWLEYSGQSQHTELLCAPISAPGDEKNRISAYILSEEKKRAALEEARLLYVAVTRAKHSLHLLGHLKIDSAAQKDSVLKPLENTLLAKLWPAVAADFQARLSETGAVDLPEPDTDTDLQLTNRVCLAPAWQPPSLPVTVAATLRMGVDTITDDPIDFDWAGEPARLIGVVVHRLLHRIGMAGIESIHQQDLERFELAGRSLLMQSGIAPQYLEVAARQVARALWIMCVEDETGRWILSNQHQDARCEWALSVMLDRSTTSVSIIDRTFVDAEGVRWIIDYKTGSHVGGGIEEFLDREQSRYQPQLERYAEVLQRMESRPVHLAIYFPLLGKWREWIPVAEKQREKL